MSYHLKYKKYLRPFVIPVNTASGLWKEREGLILCLKENRSGKIGFGEFCPLPTHGSETLEEAMVALDHFTDLKGLDKKLVGTRCAVRHAENMLHWSWAGSCKQFAVSKFYNESLVGFPPVVKFKIGILDFEIELKKIQQFLSQSKESTRVRLDANGSLSPSIWSRWVESLSGFKKQVEFIEQPLPAQDWKIMLEWAKKFTIPTALDESVPFISEEPRNLKDCILILKAHNFQYLLDQWGSFPIKERAGKMVLSSSFETSVGLWGLLNDVQNYDLGHYALGLGVSDRMESINWSFHEESTFISNAEIGLNEMWKVWENL